VSKVSWPALLARIRPHSRTLALSGALALLGAAGGLAQPLAAREVIEALADDESLLVPLVVLSGLVAFSAVIVAANFWLLERTSERIVLGTRRELATRLLRLRLSAFDREAPGDLVARATSDSTLLGSVSSTALVQLVMGAVTLVASIVLMGVVDLVLLGVTLAVLVVVGGAVAVVLPRIMRATERQQEAVGGLGAALERALGGLRTVKASGAEERETRAVTEAAERAYERGMESAGYQAIVGTATGLIVQVAFLAVLGVGGARVASGDMGVGDLIAFLLYLFYLADPIAAVSQGATQLQQGLAAVRRIDAVTTLPVEEDEAVADAAPPAAPASLGAASASPAASDGVAPLVVFDRVSFGYRADLPEVLHGVSFEVPARGVTAIVGPSGAGKTTLFALLERFYDPDMGSIRFHGRELGAWPRAALRGQIGYVEQEAPVLAGNPARQPALRRARRGRGRASRRPSGGAPRGARRAPSGRARHGDRRPRGEPVRRRATAHRDSAGPVAPAGAPPARRGGVPARRGERDGAARHRRPRRRDTRGTGHRPPPVHGRRGAADRRAGGGPGARDRHPRGARAGRCPLCRAGGHAVHHRLTPV
jgi:ABC-type multidrug transport system fused ATPase/permease subunit